jgi:hypothetical protein
MHTEQLEPSVSDADMKKAEMLLRISLLFRPLAEGLKLYPARSTNAGHWRKSQLMLEGQKFRDPEMVRK